MSVYAIGYGPSMRIFTKVFAYQRKNQLKSAIYVDDSLFLGDDFIQCLTL